MKWKLFMATIAFGASLASAKSYEIILDNPVKAGNVDLKPGKYSVNVDASQVRFTDVQSGKSVEAAAKVVASDRKFDQTTVDTKEVNGTAQIQEIDLGGTKTKVQFGQ